MILFDVLVFPNASTKNCNRQNISRTHETERTKCPDDKLLSDDIAIKGDATKCQNHNRHYDLSGLGLEGNERENKQHRIHDRSDHWKGDSKDERARILKKIGA